MEERTAKLTVSKSGGTAGKNAVTFRCTIPNKWVQELGMSRDKRDVKLTFDGTAITITKNS